MKNARKQWPSGCTVAGETSQGGTLYYDMKPVAGGEITMAMYMDDECLTEYRISTSAVEGIIGNIFTSGGGGSGDGDYDFSGDSLSQSLSRWNSAFDEWSICHSCVAHDLSNTDGSTYYGMCYDDAYQADDVYTDDKNSYYEAYNSYYGGNNRALGGGGGESCPRGNKFECYDDAGYTSVNQVRRNVYYPVLPFNFQLNEVPLNTGNLSLPLLRPSVHEVLCQDGDESCILPRYLHSQLAGNTIEERFVRFC